MKAQNGWEGVGVALLGLYDEVVLLSEALDVLVVQAHAESCSMHVRKLLLPLLVVPRLEFLCPSAPLSLCRRVGGLL